MKKQILKYQPLSEYMPKLGLMKSVVPDWYKSIEKYVGGKIQVYPQPNITVKHCMPFLDSLTIGYYIPCPADLLVESDGDRINVTWKSNDQIVITRSESVSQGMPVPAGFSSNHFAWKTKMALKAPNGYSLLITHPLNRFDLPFFTLSGVIDSNYAMGDGNLPVFFKKGYQGIIKQGTPIAQIIPIKFDNWVMEEDSNLAKESKLNNEKSIQKIYGWYKDLYWNRKTYE